MNELERIVKLQKEGVARGICSVCSSSPYVIDAAIEQAVRTDSFVLIEATANQVNQMGGYTGMKPAGFRDMVLDRADKLGLPREKVILGGDHLGPVAWKNMDSGEAMDLAETLVYEFSRAGYRKIHLDASMPLGEEVTLSTAEIADRTVRLCLAAEKGYSEYAEGNPGARPPVYVIGSEVPTPGGSGEEEDMSVTGPEDLTGMIDCFSEKFRDAGLAVWDRVIAAVVQPGVEFGNHSIHDYIRADAEKLTETARNLPGIVLEGHSTDYQKRESLREMVEDGIAVLKVGPALTFAAREAIYALSYIEDELVRTGVTDTAERSDFIALLDKAMTEEPGNWKDHYTSEEPESSFLRKYSYSDRSRYYMSAPAVKESLNRLIANLREEEMPMSLISQYMPAQYRKIKEGRLAADPEKMITDHVCEVLDDYWYACGLTEK
ncbi:MAG: class II D-tagatose-bisphosphate aldolase, non-catalytic subunit [Firmicutes bacterium]|nr:class II D-tagatose-bisphosphate aldolase, non-catalytic subunit [Bacillota bacterium]